MASRLGSCFYALVLWSSSLLLPVSTTKSEDPYEIIPKEEYDVKRSDFPKDFKFGASTSAMQIEGAYNEDGRTLSVWDEFFRRFPNKISDHSNADKGVDSYHMYKEDVKALKAAGLDSYRFSISWSRILPDGTLGGGINLKGINYYNSLIDELLKNDITPFVTLFHFDSPQALEEKYGGFLSRNMVDDFKAYSDLCFRIFGDRVKNWITINEAVIIARYGYGLGVLAPGRCTQPLNNCPQGNSSTEPYMVGHNLILAHAAAANIYKEKYQGSQKGQIGITLAVQWHMPYSKSIKDKKASYRANDFYFGWFLEPLTYGDYPDTMKSLVKERLPRFTNEEKKMLKGSADFIGINYYTARYIKDVPVIPNDVSAFFEHDIHVEEKVDKDGVLIGPKFDGSPVFYLYPKGIKDILTYMKKKYQSPTIYITENGITEWRNDSIPLAKALNDQHRIDSIQRHLHYVREAMREGVNVKAYFVWSLVDNLELSSGYTVRFGLCYIDYNDNFKRYPKESSKWLKDFLFA